MSENTTQESIQLIIKAINHCVEYPNSINGAHCLLDVFAIGTLHDRSLDDLSTLRGAFSKALESIDPQSSSHGALDIFRTIVEREHYIKSSRLRREKIFETVSRIAQNPVALDILEYMQDRQSRNFADVIGNSQYDEDITRQSLKNLIQMEIIQGTMNLPDGVDPSTRTRHFIITPNGEAILEEPEKFILQNIVEQVTDLEPR